MQQPVNVEQISNVDILSEAETVVSTVEGADLARAQFDLEDGMIEAGKSKYWELVNKAHKKADRGADLIPSRSAIRLGTDKFAEAIAAWVLKCKNKGRGPKPSGYRTISSLDPETTAFIALRVIFNHIAVAAEVPLPKLAIKVGIAIAEEATLRQFEERHPAIVQLIRERLTSKSRLHHRRVLRASLARKAPDILETNLPDASYLLVGLPLIEIAETSTGLINTKRTKRSSSCMLSDDCKKFFEDVHERAQYFQPVYGPTIIPPRPWSTFKDGGYHFALAGKITLVKTRDKVHRRLLSEAHMPRVYAGLNALQNTAWQVNRRVLDVMMHAAHLDTGIGGLPKVGIVHIPECPADIPRNPKDRTPEQDERLTAWKIKAAEAWKETEERNGKRHGLSQALALAEQYAAFDRIYFPHTLDFRGRAYPITSYLTPQGTDYQKALIHFAEAKPLTAENRGLYWLAVHGANCMGTCPETGKKLDKGKLVVRNAWVHDNSARIWEVARDPMAHRDWWTQADSPWCFLAFCFEWEDACAALARGATLVSSVPVAFDGSCNGLQHFSAMMRDEVGGSAVNLVPHEEPADIYSEVMSRVIERLVKLAAEPDEVIEEEPEEEDEAEEEDEDEDLKKKPKRKRLPKQEYARRWLASGQLNRDLFKRPVMTMPYGSKQFGIKGQVRGKLKERKFKFPDGSDGFNEAGFLSGEIMSALGKVVVKAREVMDWLQESAAALTKEGAAVAWKTPSGFIVRQAYPMTSLKRVDTFFHGASLRPGLTVEHEGTLNKHKQTNGVSPNFVHSMDGTAMILTVDEMVEKRLADAFAMIHDSYGTHAACAQVLFETLRDVFVRLYTEHDPFGDYVEAVQGQLTDGIRPPPNHGTLDLNQIRQSDFFFA